MRKLFTITGLFYEIGEYRFRKFLHLRKKGTDQKLPDLNVVMMNPGSSRPLDGNAGSGVETETMPDNTQYQIMRVMLNCGLTHARIFNLSDLRESRSSVFYLKAAELESRGVPHSIFMPERRDDFQLLFDREIPVIFAWGVSEKLKHLAELAIERIGRPGIGVRKHGVPHAYYHPLPQNAHKQKDWVETISGMLSAVP